jgi:hypothetical protein
MSEIEDNLKAIKYLYIWNASFEVKICPEPGLQ